MIHDDQRRALAATTDSLKRLLDRLDKEIQEAQDPGRPGVGAYITGGFFDEIDDELNEAYRLVGKFLPKYDPSRYVWVESQRTYDADLLAAFVSRIIARLEAAIASEAAPPSLPVRRFSFIEDSAIRLIVERDYSELQKCAITGAWKAVLVLSGACIEGILFDRVRRDQSEALATTAAKSLPGEPDRWTLGALLAVCDEAGWLPAGASKHRSGLVDYRNVVHPAVEQRAGLRPHEAEARIAMEILHILAREYAAADAG
jgi:hypothetical protein